jgi:uncharacterized protein YjbI with pentapeptide repeats
VITNLTDANLSGANLSNANLLNMIKIKYLQINYNTDFSNALTDDENFLNLLIDKIKKETCLY